MPHELPKDLRKLGVPKPHGIIAQCPPNTQTKPPESAIANKRSPRTLRPMPT